MVAARPMAMVCEKHLAAADDADALSDDDPGDSGDAPWTC
jgi:hypothetical protein